MYFSNLSLINVMCSNLCVPCFVLSCDRLFDAYSQFLALSNCSVIHVFISLYKIRTIQPFAE